MSSPTIVATVAGNTNLGGPSTSHAIPYPAGATGDLIIAVMGFGTGVTTGSMGAGWTQLQSPGSFGLTDGHGEVWYRVTDGSEGSTFTFTTSTSTHVTHIVWRLANYVGTPVAAAWANNVGGQPAFTNPPSLTSGFGSVETMWLAVGVSGTGTRTWNADPNPSGYGGITSYSLADNSHGPSMAVSYKITVAASEDPGQMDFSAAAWQCSTTVAIQGGGTPLVGVQGSMSVGLIG